MRLQGAVQRIKESVSAGDAFCQALVGDIERCGAGLASHDSYSAGGSKMLMNQCQAHYVQRSSNVAWAGQQAYQTTARFQMQSAFSPLSNNNNNNNNNTF